MTKSEEIIVYLKQVNSTRSIRINRNSRYIRSLYNATLKEYNNTEYFRLVKYLFNLNRRYRFFFRRNHRFIIRMYNAFLKAKQSQQIQPPSPPPPQNEPQTESSTSSVKKAALLIGINYKGSNYELGGCENDIINTKNILINQYGYKERDIVMLAESFGEKPTQRNIIRHMRNLVNKSNNGYTSLWFQYSGHGYYIRDTNYDERDRKDECIVTSDMKIITDDEFRRMFTSRININTKMFCLMDCCHSGTIMDLKYKYRSQTNNWTTENRYPVRANIIAISGCRDAQTSADAWMRGKWRGALTTCFTDTLKSNYNQNIFTLLENTRALLRSKNFTQIPQLTSSYKINNNYNFST